jgi:predicted nucleic acid-binding protein
LNRFVLDASVALTWCFPEENASSAHHVLELLGSSGALVPALWPLEIANALLVAERRKRIKRADAQHFVALLQALPIEIDADTAGRALKEILSLARETNISAYDAAYLELAIREALPLATLDDAMAGAARRSGVRLVTR